VRLRQLMGLSLVKTRLPEHSHHTIRSFVTRPGRLTRGQSRALENHWKDYGIDFTDQRICLDKIFGRTAPVTLEIGSGMGEVILELARKYPEDDHLCVEVHTPGVGSLIRKASIASIENIRVIKHDVVDSLKTLIADNSLDKVCIFFPDPWPKKRHHKRRLLQPEFLNLLKPKLKKNGCLFLATDWEGLAEHMITVCDADNELINLAGQYNYAARPLWRGMSKFELRGKRLGHSVWDLAYCLR
jgi:tRNA (guanine-N7-)-methyltransferase